MKEALSLSVTSIEFLEHLRRKDEAAWAQLVRRYAGRIIQYARSHLRQRPQAAEELAYSVLYAFFTGDGKNRYDPRKGRLRDWLFGIARRRFRNRRRQARRRREVQAATDSLQRRIIEGIVDKRDRDSDPDYNLRLEALRRCMQEACNQASAQTAAAFRLYVMEGKPACVVARILKMRRNAVYLAKYRVVQRIRELAAETKLF